MPCSKLLKLDGQFTSCFVVEHVRRVVSESYFKFSGGGALHIANCIWYKWPNKYHFVMTKIVLIELDNDDQLLYFENSELELIFWSEVCSETRHSHGTEKRL